MIEATLFPAAPRRFGLYRFRFRGNGLDRHCVGETNELQRRFQQYRTPGRSRQADIGMSAEFRAHPAAGGNIEIDIVAGGEPVRADLADKAIRRLLERAALVEEGASGTIFLNR